jgi:hypothetical protein
MATSVFKGIRRFSLGRRDGYVEEWSTWVSERVSEREGEVQ